MKPDRFTKMVEPMILRLRLNPGSPHVTPECAAALMRHQHAAMVRMVKREPGNIMMSGTEYKRGAIDTCDILLAKLARYKKGTP